MAPAAQDAWLQWAIRRRAGIGRLPAMSKPEPASATDDPQDDRARLRELVEAQCRQYDDDVEWSAPRRGISVRGRDAVRRFLLDEIDSMSCASITELRAQQSSVQAIREYSVRFRYPGAGIVGVEFPTGARLELERLSIATLDVRSRIVRECAIETWTWLLEVAPACTSGH